MIPPRSNFNPNMVAYTSYYVQPEIDSNSISTLGRHGDHATIDVELTVNEFNDLRYDVRNSNNFFFINSNNKNTCMYIYIYIYAYINTFLYLHTYIYIYTYIYMYIYIYT
jgi:hypothetical protein